MIIIKILFFPQWLQLCFSCGSFFPCKILKILFEELFVGLRPEWERVDGKTHEVMLNTKKTAAEGITPCKLYIKKSNHDEVWDKQNERGILLFQIFLVLAYWAGFNRWFVICAAGDLQLIYANHPARPENILI